MTTKTANRQPVDIGLGIADENIVDKTFERVTGAELISGNSVDLLQDAAENYPAWLDAIARAERRVFLESYLVHEDEQGTKFADALKGKARQGVEVKVVFDWMGGLGHRSRSFLKSFADAGVEVRFYNPPKLSDPLGVFSRDHRKTIAVDSRIAFVGGLGIGQDWVGYPDRDIAGWRDTGLKITGPAVADVEAAFADVWATTGDPMNAATLVRRDTLESTGEIALRVIQSVPGMARMYRTDQLLAAFAGESIWLTDAYFIGIPAYLQSIKDAAADGVDVRILVPQTTDIALICETTRWTYRPLLEAGIRIFEWNGPMMHAKTAVFDRRFSRVGSTNLNIASWFGNYELDVLIESEEFAGRMREMLESDMANSTEIVLSDTHRPKPRRPRAGRRLQRRKGDGSVRKATAGAINAAASISTAIAKRSILGPAEAKLLAILGLALLGLAILFAIFPRIAAVPLVLLLLLVSLPTLFKAFQSYRKSG